MIHIWRPWKLSSFQDHPTPVHLVRNSSSPCTLNVQSQTNRPLSKWYYTCELTKLKQTQNQVTSHSKWPRVLLFDLTLKQCNGIIKGWFYCLTSELKGRFLANNILMFGSAWCLANPVFFNKKEIGRLDVQNTHYPHPTAPPTSDNISFLPDTPPPPSKWTP